MARTKWIGPNNHLVQYLVISKGSHLKIRIFSSKQQHSPRSQYLLQHILHVYYRSQWIFFTSVFLRLNILIDPISHTKAFHRLNADFAKFPFILDLLYSVEANNQQHFHAVLHRTICFCKSFESFSSWLQAQDKFFFQTMRLHFSYPSGYFRDTEPSA